MGAGRFHFMPSIFYNARSAEWREHVRRNPATISRGDLTATVIRTPDTVTDAMDGSSYVKRIETVVDMLRSDYERLALGINLPFTATVSGETKTYRVAEMLNDDENEPTVQFLALKLQ
jgi:hypothetical protein